MLKTIVKQIKIEKIVEIHFTIYQIFRGKEVETDNIWILMLVFAPLYYKMKSI